MTRARLWPRMALGAAALALAACGGTSGGGGSTEPSDEPETFEFEPGTGTLEFAPLSGQVPSATDFALVGSTDGTLQNTGLD